MDSPEEGASNAAWEVANSGGVGLDANTGQIRALSKAPQATIRELA